MKKNNYIKPKITVYSVETTQILAGSPQGDSIPATQSEDLFYDSSLEDVSEVDAQ